MNTATNKERGNTGLAMAIAYYGSNGYIVSVPLNDTQDYDLIVDNSIPQRVQVKFTLHKGSTGYKVNLKSSGGTKGTIYKHVVDTDIEILFVVTELGIMYAIPSCDVNNRSSLTLNSSCDKYIVKLLGEVGQLAGPLDCKSSS